MTLVGIKFDKVPSGSEIVRRCKDEIEKNSDKPVVKILFNVKAYCIESDILIINKEFIAQQNMNYVFLFMAVITAIPWFVWNFRTPFFVVVLMILLWSFLSTPAFNFFMFKIMIRRLGFKGKVTML